MSVVIGHIIFQSTRTKFLVFKCSVKKRIITDIENHINKFLYSKSHCTLLMTRNGHRCKTCLFSSAES
ncbi:hypothetical protein BpHYR1_029521 [Brachionus plicatilis]|uniref:Uncharacterized protein n=1 Tax=Brachionus plicatilis TaxID=10195 RepID=A0A3M7R651_BRAPC|nr:hypothetical protein BpHYR1_029521 [Brachionus plicatilis]